VQDQEGRWYLLRVRPYRTADNRIEGAVLQLLDVGELKRTLEDVRHARDYAQTIVDTVREPLAVLDDSLALQDANRSFFNYFTLSRKDMIGKRGPEMTRGPLANPNLLAQLATVVDRGAQIHDLEIDYELAGLGRRILAVTARRMPAERPLILLAFEDITDRKLAEEARYRRLFEHSKDGIVIVDAATGEIVDINPYIEQLFGRKRTETVAMKFWEVPPLRDLPHAASALDRIRQQGMARFADVTATTKEGRALQFEIIANVYPEGDRSVIQFNLRDLTERRNFDRELQHTARLESLGMMAGGIAHDFNNLLTGILGNASLMYSSTAVGERNRSYLSDIMRASEQAGRLTQQMLAYAGKGRYVTERLRVAELIQDAAALIRTSIPPSVELRIHDGDDTSEIEGDPGQLRQLLMNLVVNGAEAIGENRPGRVEIRTSGLTLSREETAERFAGDDLAPGRYVAIEVSDTGEGMDEATRARIFEPFFSTKFTGRGLGLAAALGIVRSHGGAVRAYSTPAQGSLFRVLLPEAPTETADVRPPASAARRSHGKILLSEDDAAVRNVTKEALERAGFTVITADNGREAVNALRTRADEVRLVVLDILMPAAGGENTLKEIRAIRGDVPVVVISGLDRAEAVRRFGKDGFAAFLQKPYSHTRLVDAVTGVLDGRR
jgi:PAS domain S-box-containing protein